MACIELTQTPVASPVLTLKGEPQAAVDFEQVPKPELETVLVAATLTLGEVCTVNGGTLVVLAGADGPFRTRDGGYFLLDPSTNPPED